MNKVIWIIGASSGIGLELVKLFLENGFFVIASSRKILDSQELNLLQEQYPKHLNLINIDVTDTDSVNLAVENAWGIHQKIDISLYNAGVYEKMDISSWDINHFEMMNQVNYLGAVRLLNKITPLFSEAKGGHLVFNISISSYFGLPYGGGYSAPKAALLNLCESIKPELESLNIDLQILNHGFVKTRLTAKNDFEMPQLLSAEEAAQKIYNGVMGTKRFEIKFPWFLSTFLYLLRVVPYSLAFRFTKKAL